MSGPETLEDMQALLASIREAINNAHEDAHVRGDAGVPPAEDGESEEASGKDRSVAAATNDADAAGTERAECASGGAKPAVRHGGAVVTPLYPAAHTEKASATAPVVSAASIPGAAGAVDEASPQRLSPKVQARVRNAMARMERIEAARRALGGEEALRQLVADLVEPLLKEWLEENLPEIVERRVAEEIARITGRGEACARSGTG